MNDAAPWTPQFEWIIREHLPELPSDQDLGGEVPLALMGLDSLASVELLVAIENGLGIEFPDTFLNQSTFSTVQTLWSATKRVLDEL